MEPTQLNQSFNTPPPMMISSRRFSEPFEVVVKSHAHKRAIRNILGKRARVTVETEKEKDELSKKVMKVAMTQTKKRAEEWDPDVLQHKKDVLPDHAYRVNYMKSLTLPGRRLQWTWCDIKDFDCFFEKLPVLPWYIREEIPTALEYNSARTHLLNYGVHYAFHGQYLIDTLKLHTYSTPAAIANFNGLDLPSAYYEDHNLVTVPAFWINHKTYHYNPTIRHNDLDGAGFQGLVPSLRQWNNYLEDRYRWLWVCFDFEHLLACWSKGDESKFDNKKFDYILAVSRWKRLTMYKEGITLHPYKGLDNISWWPTSRDVFLDLSKEIERGDMESDEF
ncbi:hypothetical protein ID866_8436 [Astraeus odoratus]|nr:hypothetical protein ID866_8436 [Astraeus odoratus]